MAQRNRLTFVQAFSHPLNDELMIPEMLAKERNEVKCIVAAVYLSNSGNLKQDQEENKINIQIV